MTSDMAKRVRIMVVEDEAIVAMDLEQQLAAVGYEVIGLFSTGEEAIERVVELQPDAILMDITLRGATDGIQTAGKIRLKLDVPIIYLTAHSDEETFSRARITDPMAYVLKPFDRRGLRAAIELGLHRHRTDRKLRQMERWLASTLRSIGDALIHDLDGRITYMNEIAVRLTGRSVEEAYGLVFDEVCPLVDPNGQPVESPIRQVLREGAVLGLATGTRLLRRDGRQVTVEDSAAPIRDDAGRITGAVIILRDAAEQESVRARLEDTENQLRQSQKMEALGHLSGGIAHDFNNLITVILGYSDVLQRLVPRSSEASGALDNIRYASLRAADLTQRLLAFSRKQVVRPEMLILSTVVHDMIGMLERIIREDIELQVAAGGTPGTVRADRGQIEQVLLNLATNARDAMPTGGRLQVTTTTIDVVSATASVNAGLLPGSYVLLEVADTGIGMDDATRTRIFEPFFTTKDTGRGTGLGLSTVYAIVRQSGGTISVESEPGHGSTFRIYFPRANAVVGSAVAERFDAALPTGSETILIVEDNEPLCDLIQNVLTRAAYSTIVCRDGEAALEQAQSDTQFDAVLMDVVLPRMGGADFIDRLRAARPHTKVLLMSGYAEEAVGPKRASSTQAPFIPKPFTVRQLCVRLRQVLDAPRSA